jgi:excisionase family DNA binding protein
MPVRVQVLDAQRAVVALELNFRHVADRLKRVLARRADVLTDKDRLVAPSKPPPARGRRVRLKSQPRRMAEEGEVAAGPGGRRAVDIGDDGIKSGLLDYESAARYLCTTTRHVRELWTRRELAAVKVGRSVRFTKADLDAFIAANRIRAVR